jgi:hypothetical protein
MTSLTVEFLKFVRFLYAVGHACRVFVDFVVLIGVISQVITLSLTLFYATQAVSPITFKTVLTAIVQVQVALDKTHEFGDLDIFRFFHRFFHRFLIRCWGLCLLAFGHLEVLFKVISELIKHVNCML